MKSSNFRILDGGLIFNRLAASSNEIEASQNAMSDNATLESDVFDNYVSRYYYSKSVEQNLSGSTVLAFDVESSEQLAEILLRMPVNDPRQVLLKLNILENELANDMDCAEPVGRKHVMHFAALKADLITIMADMG